MLPDEIYFVYKNSYSAQSKLAMNRLPGGTDTEKTCQIEGETLMKKNEIQCSLRRNMLKTTQCQIPKLNM